MDTLIRIPLSEIREDALLRDRSRPGPDSPCHSALDHDRLVELALSIALDGLRQPIEVWALSEPDETHRYGLISGLRRLTSFRMLADTHPDCATIPAFIRQPADIPAAMAAMVTENEIRAQITPWEKGRLITAAVAERVFPTPDAAVAALYPALSRQNRARLRAFASVVEELDGTLATPERLSVQRLERLAAALRGDFADLIHASLATNRKAGLESQWAALEPILAESLTEGPGPASPDHPRAPRRMLHLKQGLTIRRELARTGWILRFSGPEARTGGLIDDVMDLVEKRFQGE